MLQGVLEVHFDGSTGDLRAWLANGKASAQKIDSLGRTLLHLITFNTQFEAPQIELLLTSGFDLHARDAAGRTPLHYARFRGAVKELLAHGARVDAVDVQGWTPLHTYASQGYTDLVPLLTQAGADLNARDPQRHTPWDVRLGTLDVEDELFALGARSGIGETVKTVREPPRMEWFWSHWVADEAQDGDVRLATLAASLAPRSAEDLVIFHQHLEHVVAAAYTRKVGALAQLLDAGGSDDGLEDFAAWLVSKGDRFYAAARKNPETLVKKRLEVDIGKDSIDGVLFAAYARATGQDGARVLDAPCSIAFEFPPIREQELDWDEEKLRVTFPKLFALRDGRR